MKKLFAILMIFFLSESNAHAVLISRPDPRNQLISDLFTINKLSSFEDYRQWFPKNIRYQEDYVRDEWAAPETTISRGVGDCEDLAFLNQAVLSRLGYQTMVLSIHGPNLHHAICVYIQNGQFYWMDNFEVHSSSAHNLHEFFQALFRAYKISRIFELNGEDGSSHILFQI